MSPFSESQWAARVVLPTVPALWWDRAVLSRLPTLTLTGVLGVVGRVTDGTQGTWLLVLSKVGPLLCGHGVPTVSWVFLWWVTMTKLDKYPSNFPVILIAAWDHKKTSWKVLSPLSSHPFLVPGLVLWNILLLENLYFTHLVCLIRAENTENHHHFNLLRKEPGKELWSREVVMGLNQAWE